MEKELRWLRISCYTGATFDGLTVIPMLSPAIGGALFGIPDFQPGPEYRYAMGIAASLMLGWTALLLWAARSPFRRKGVLILTVFPVIVGLAAAGVYAVSAGVVPASGMAPTWVFQTAIASLFTYSYVQAARARAQGRSQGAK
jgi:hypothetical protein